MIRAVLLDADGVVQHGRYRGSALLAELGGDAFWADVWAIELELFTGGEFRPALEALLRRRQSPVPYERALGIWTAIEVDAEVVDLVGRLHDAGYRCVLASNQQEFRAGHMRRSLGYEDVFDTLFFSCDLGHAKPDVDFFAAVVRALGIPAGSALFVDDRCDNVAGARAAGLAAEVHDPASGVAGLRELLAWHGVTA